MTATKDAKPQSQYASSSQQSADDIHSVAQPAVISAGLPIQLMSTQEVRVLFRRSARTVREWCRTGKLQPVRVGRSVFFRSIDVNQIILVGKPK